ncbi:MAG TPA: LysM domain-containing protein [Neobacillus sp.]
MKRLFGMLLVVLILYVIYIDLTIGTLPSDTQKVGALAEQVVKPGKGIPSFTEKVKPGETVITIVENHLNKPIPVPITVLIQDFCELNPGKVPEKIQIGTTYTFPDYSK